MDDDQQFSFASGNLSDIESFSSVTHADELFSKGKILPLEQPAKADSLQIQSKSLKQKQYLLSRSSPNHGLRTTKTPKSSKYTFRGEFYGMNPAAPEFKTPKTPAGKEHKTPRMPGTPSKVSNSPERGEAKRGYQESKYTSISSPPNPDHTKENEENEAPTFAHDPSKCRGSSMRKSFLDFLPFGSRNGSSSPPVRLHSSISSKRNTFARSFSLGSSASPKKTNPHEAEVAARRRSYLPYKQNLLGWLGCVVDVYDRYEPSASVPVW